MNHVYCFIRRDVYLQKMHSCSKNIRWYIILENRNTGMLRNDLQTDSTSTFRYIVTIRYLGIYYLLHSGKKYDRPKGHDQDYQNMMIYRIVLFWNNISSFYDFQSFDYYFYNKHELSSRWIRIRCNNEVIHVLKVSMLYHFIF